MHHRLRTYLGEVEAVPTIPTVPPPPIQVSVRFSEIQALLTDAIRQDCRWLDDFGEDTVQITPDLYDVILAYRRFRKSA